MSGRVAIGALLLAVACGESSPPPATATAAPTTTTPATCERGAPCAPEGSTCTPEPIGTGWAHGFTCSGGTWSDLEIAPLPIPPPQPPSSAVPES